MEGAEKTLVYAFTATGILGIMILGALVLTSHTTEEEITELYFEDLYALPSVVKVGDKIDFSFTLSHEKKQTTYDYRVTYDGHEIKSGSFSDEASGFKTINISMTPKNSSLVKMADPVVNQYKMKYNAALGTISSQFYGSNQMKILTSPNGYSLIFNNTTNRRDVNMPGKFILPIRQQITDGISLLIFDPKLKESYNTSLLTVISDGFQEDAAPSDGRSISNLGYTVNRDDWNIVNDKGNFDIRHNNSSTVYRYAFKKVSVKVSSTGPKTSGTYEIHFWIMVKEDPDKLQGMFALI